MGLLLQGSNLKREKKLSGIFFPPRGKGSNVICLLRKTGPLLTDEYLFSWARLSQSQTVLPGSGPHQGEKGAHFSTSLAADEQGRLCP